MHFRLLYKDTSFCHGNWIQRKRARRKAQNRTAAKNFHAHSFYLAWCSSIYYFYLRSMACHQRIANEKGRRRRWRFNCCLKFSWLWWPEFRHKGKLRTLLFTTVRKTVHNAMRTHFLLGLCNTRIPRKGRVPDLQKQSRCKSSNQSVQFINHKKALFLM